MAFFSSMTPRLAYFILHLRTLGQRGVRFRMESQLKVRVHVYLVKAAGDCDSNGLPWNEKRVFSTYNSIYSPNIPDD
jgi:hypothetical protein